MYTLDFNILDWIQQVFRCGLLDKYLPRFTHLADSGIFWILLVIFLLCDERTREDGFTCLVAMVINILLCNILIKPLVARIRPYDLRPYIEIIVEKPDDFSFPSGHTAISFVVTCALFLKKNKMWIPALVTSLIIGFSRLYLYVHYPTDVLGGMIIGIISGIAGFYLVKWLAPKFHKPAKAQ